MNTEEEATPQQVAKAVKFVRENKVPAVFCESTVNTGGKEQIMRETGAKDGGTLYVDSSPMHPVRYPPTWICFATMSQPLFPA